MNHHCDSPTKSKSDMYVSVSIRLAYSYVTSTSPKSFLLHTISNIPILKASTFRAAPWFSCNIPHSHCSTLLWCNKHISHISISSPSVVWTTIWYIRYIYSIMNVMLPIVHANMKNNTSLLFNSLQQEKRTLLCILHSCRRQRIALSNSPHPNT